MSLDGYIEDKNGDFHWENADSIHPLVIELLRPVGTYLYGRRLYELMASWEAPVETYKPEHRDFAWVWQQAQKIVFSRTLKKAATRYTRVERTFDPAAIAKLKRDSGHDITIGGAALASAAIEADLVDECALLIHPVFCGGGKPAFRAGLRRKLELIETRRAGTGVIYARYKLLSG